MKYITCECGKRYRDGNKKHFESADHKQFIQSKKIKETNELTIIVHDIDKNELMEFIQSKANNKRKYIIDDDDKDDDPNDEDYSDGSDKDSSDSYASDSDEGDECECE